MLGKRILQVWWWYLQWFRRYRKKTRGGLEIALPSGARVKLQRITVHSRYESLNNGTVATPTSSGFSSVVLFGDRCRSEAPLLCTYAQLHILCDM